MPQSVKYCKNNNMTKWWTEKVRFTL